LTGDFSDVRVEQRGQARTASAALLRDVNEKVPL
jgi:hypothetical protein